MGRAPHLCVRVHERAQEKDQLVGAHAFHAGGQRGVLGGREIGEGRAGGDLDHEGAAGRLDYLATQPGEILTVARGAVDRLERVGAVLGEERAEKPDADNGDGVSRLLEYVIAIFSSEGGIAAIDEFENGLHHSTLRAIWSAQT